MEDIDSIYNFDVYDDPALYDDEYDSYRTDVPLLLKWASLTKGNVIDIACGTGRATIPLASKGYKVIGVDVHKGMLEAAKKKTRNLNFQIEWVLQDCTKLNLNTKANLVYTVGNSFQHFLTNEAQDGLISSVSNHLNDKGIFIFGTRFPNAEELLPSPLEEYLKTYTDENTKMEVDVYHVSSYDALNQIQHNSTIRRLKNAEGKIVNESKTNISLRYVFPKEMERLLTKHGFRILHIYRDWDESPVTNDNQEMIYVCQKNGGK